jgi:hypothetical protein
MTILIISLSLTFLMAFGNPARGMKLLWGGG